MRRQSIPNGLILGTVDKNTTSTKLAVIGENGEVGYILKSELGIEGGPSGLTPTLQQVASMGNSFAGRLKTLEAIEGDDVVTLSQVDNIIGANDFNYAELVELTTTF